MKITINFHGKTHRWQKASEEYHSNIVLTTILTLQVYSSGLCTFKDSYFTIRLSNNHQGILLKFYYDRAVLAWSLRTSISDKSPGAI